MSISYFQDGSTESSVLHQGSSIRRARLVLGSAVKSFSSCHLAQQNGARPNQSSAAPAAPAPQVGCEQERGLPAFDFGEPEAYEAFCSKCCHFSTDMLCDFCHVNYHLINCLNNHQPNYSENNLFDTAEHPANSTQVEQQGQLYLLAQVAASDRWSLSKQRWPKMLHKLIHSS